MYRNLILKNRYCLCIKKKSITEKTDIRSKIYIYAAYTSCLLKFPQQYTNAILSGRRKNTRERKTRDKQRNRLTADIKPTRKKYNSKNNAPDRKR